MTSAISKIAPKDQQPDTVPVIRTLDSMRKDLADLQKADRDISKAKLFNNVITEPIFDVPLDQVLSMKNKLKGDKSSFIVAGIQGSAIVR